MRNALLGLEKANVCPILSLCSSTVENHVECAASDQVRNKPFDLILHVIRYLCYNFKISTARNNLDQVDEEDNFSDINSPNFRKTLIIIT